MTDHDDLMRDPGEVVEDGWSKGGREREAAAAVAVDLDGTFSGVAGCVMLDAIARRDDDRERLVAQIRGLQDCIRQLEQRLRRTCQTLVEAVGADGPCSAEDAAERAKAEIERLQGRVRELEDCQITSCPTCGDRWEE